MKNTKETLIGNMKYRDGFKKESCHLLVLKVLSEGEKSGHEISQQLKERSEGAIILPEGTLLPILYKLEDAHLISSKRHIIENRRERVYYHIEQYGIDALDEMIKAYEKVSIGINKILNYKEGL